MFHKDTGTVAKSTMVRKSNTIDVCIKTNIIDVCIKTNIIEVCIKTNIIDVCIKTALGMGQSGGIASGAQV